MSADGANNRLSEHLQQTERLFVPARIVKPDWATNVFVVKHPERRQGKFYQALIRRPGIG